MSDDALVSAHIDRKVKEEADAVLARIGLDAAQAITMMMTRIAREKALPFDPLVPNATTVAAMEEARAGNLPRFETVRDLMADLGAED